MQTDEMVAWLGKIWDEDESAAHAVKPLGEVVVMGGERHPESWSHSRYTVASEDGYPRTLSDPEAVRHFGRHEPTAVLARIAAERELLAEYRETVTYYDNVSAPAGEVTGLETALKIIASGYAARAGYDEGWRP